MHPVYSGLIWQALVWLHVTGPVILGIDPDNPSSPGGVSYSESLDSDCISSPLWGGMMCISKFWWITPVLPTPCQGLMVYMGRFHCYSTTTCTSCVFQQSHILCFPPNAFCQTRQRALRLEHWKLSFSSHIMSLLAGRLLMLMLVS